MNRLSLVALFIVNLLWLWIMMMEISGQKSIWLDFRQGDTFHSYKLKTSRLKMHLNMCVNSLPKQIQSIYFECSILYIILSDFLLYWLRIPLLFKVILVLINTGLPFIILEIGLAHIEKAIDGELLGFLQSLNASLHQTEDLIKALKYSEKTVQNKYLKELLSNFNGSIYSGLDEKVAFQHFHRFAGHDYLKYIVLNLEQVYFRRGNLVKLVSGLEQEYTAIQVEMNKRKIELRQDRALTIGSMLLVLLTAYMVVKANDYIMTYYLLTSTGKSLLCLLGIAYALGIFIVIRAAHIRY